MSTTVTDAGENPKVSQAFNELMKARQELKRRKDDEVLGRITEQLMEGIIMRHTEHTLEELGAAHKVIDRLESGLGAITNA